MSALHPFGFSFPLFQLRPPSSNGKILAELLKKVNSIFVKEMSVPDLIVKILQNSCIFIENKI